MSGVPSLESSIRTCQVDTAWAARAQSDRFLNTNALMCPTWTGVDLAGRPVSADSFYTKSPGCNSAEDRVVVESALRPNYMEYITLNPQGIQGSMYGVSQCGVKNGAQSNSQMLNNLRNVTGGFNNSMLADVIPSCGMFGYEAAQAQARRQAQAAGSSYNSAMLRQQAGNL